MQNAPDIGSYTRAVDSGQFTTVKGPEFSGDDQVRGASHRAADVRFAVDLHAVGGGADFSKELEQLDALSVSGVVHHNGRHVVVTEKGDRSFA